MGLAKLKGEMDQISDETLMGRVGVGDADAYACLVTRHLSRSIALAGRIVRNRADAEELVQEAFLRVWTTAPRWRTDGASFRTWFFRVLVNLCIDRCRRPGFAPLEAAGDPADGATPADLRLAGDEEAAALARAVQTLPPKQRAALALCYWQEMSNQDAAAALSLTVGAVESLLVRARRNLRAALEPHLGPATVDRRNR